jgi:large subunit ribosomal protein L19
MVNEKIMQYIKPGATVRVIERVVEGDKERQSRFEGLVLARKHGKEPGASFTVRSVVAGVGVEKVYPLYSPRIEKVEVLSSPKKISRSKMYYVRNLSRKGIRQKLGTIEKFVAPAESEHVPAVNETSEEVVENLTEQKNEVATKEISGTQSQKSEATS